MGESALADYLDALELSTGHIAELFVLLDRDDSGAVDIEEFIDGCNKLKGDAKSFDVHRISLEVKSIKELVNTLAAFVVESFAHFDVEVDMESFETEIRKTTSTSIATRVNKLEASR